jgi:protein-disulfide isomerase
LLLGLGCALIVVLLAAGGAAGWLLMSRGQVTEIEPVLEEGPAVGGAAWSDDDAPVPISSEDPTWGSRTAPVTLVVFSEFECPYCGKLARTIDGLKGKYGESQLRVVFKHFPLPMHEQARPAATAAQAVFRAGGGGAFWTFHDRAFAHSKELSDSRFEQWAEDAGVRRSAFRRALDSSASAKVDADTALGKRLGIRGTPSSFVNGIFVTGARDVAHLSEIIDGQLAAAKAARALGTPADAVYVKLCKKNFNQKPLEEGTKEKPPEDDSTTVWAVPVGPDDPVRGPADALVTVVEFSEFQCPFCQRVQGSLEKVRAEYGDQVRIVWKDNPLPFHKRADPAAVVAREARRQLGDRGFWAAHDLLFANQKQLEDTDLLRYAGQLELDVSAVRNALSTKAHRSIIETGMEQASDFEAKGTPQFFINGRRLKGAQPIEKFRAIIDEEIPKAKALLARGVAPSELYEKITAEGRGPKGLETITLSAPPAGAPFRGPPGAKVVIQAFSDFECPFCARARATLEQVLREHGDDVKIVFRHKPLPMHKSAALAAEAAQEAMAQKGNAAFWAYHDKLFDHQKDTGLERPALERYAVEVGLDIGRFKRALDSRTHKAYVEADMRASETAGITGTPTFVVGAYLVRGAQPYTAFRKAIRQQLNDSAAR